MIKFSSACSTLFAFAIEHERNRRNREEDEKKQIIFVVLLFVTTARDYNNIQFKWWIRCVAVAAAAAADGGALANETPLSAGLSESLTSSSSRQIL